MKRNLSVTALTALLVVMAPLSGLAQAQSVDQPDTIASGAPTAYVLVTVVGSDLGGNSVVGIYRVDSPNHFTVIADIGAWSIANPPDPSIPIDVPTGVQFALQPYRGGFLVTDGHHNRVLRVTLAGTITEVIRFKDIVP